MAITNALACDGTPRDHLLAEDHQWLERFRQFCRSHAAFLFAVRASSTNATDLAAEVMVWRNGTFTTVRELVHECGNHRWNGLIYEAWVWETAHRVRRLIDTLDGTAAQALTLHAQHTDYYEIDDAAMWNAIDQARRAMEGETDWTCDSLFDSDTTAESTAR